MKISSLSIEVKRVLLNEWDPIGIKNIPEAVTEYDAYVPGICRLLKSSQLIEEVYGHLCWIAADRMGLNVDKNRTMTVAKILINLSVD